MKLAYIEIKPIMMHVYDMFKLWCNKILMLIKLSAIIMQSIRTWYKKSYACTCSKDRLLYMILACSTWEKKPYTCNCTCTWIKWKNTYKAIYTYPLCSILYTMNTKSICNIQHDAHCLRIGVVNILFYWAIRIISMFSYFKMFHQNIVCLVYDRHA